VRGVVCGGVWGLCEVIWGTCVDAGSCFKKLSIVELALFMLLKEWKRLAKLHFVDHSGTLSVRKMAGWRLRGRKGVGREGREGWEGWGRGREGGREGGARERACTPASARVRRDTQGHHG
jgi:hypothetical protein